MVSTLSGTLSLLANRMPLRLTLFLLLAWLAALPAISQAGGMNMFHDAQYLSAYERHARLTLLQFGQLPFWDPYNCGGLYGFASPQTRYTSPLFAFSLALGVDRASALFAVLWPALAMEGMFRYARSWGSTTRMALLCAPLFPLGGFFATSWYVGWVQFLSFCGLPWILLGLRGALRGSRSSLYLCSVSCLLTVGFSGSWTLPMAAPLCAFEVFDALTRSRAELRALRTHGGARAPWLSPRRGRAVVWGLLVTSVLMLSMSAYRLWPLLESARATLRVMGGEPAHKIGSLARQLFMLSHGGDNHDYGAYYVTPLVLLSVLALPFRRGLTLWLSAITCACLALGHFSAFSPFALLRKLPVYDTMRYPERFLLELTIVLSVLFARALSVGIAWCRRRLGRRAGLRATAAASLVLVAGVACQIYNVKQVSSDVRLEPTPVAHAAPFRQSRGNRWLMSHFEAEGMGSLACGEAYPVPMSRHLRGDLAHEEYVIPDGRGDAPGTVQRLSWSPNALTLRVVAKRPLRVAINQNYHPGWRAEGGEVESWDGLLSVRVPAGDSRVVLRFRPRSGIGGLWVTLLSLCAGAVWAFKKPRARRNDILLLGAGPMLWLTFMLAWPEQPLLAPTPTTPDGSPVYVEALPPDVRRMHVTFDAPITLEGARLGPVTMHQGHRQIEIDLFFRRLDKLSPNLGVFVFLISPGKRSEHGDHDMVSGLVYLPRMREGELARDAFRIAVPDDAIGAWQVRVGFWNKYGDQARRKVTSSRGVGVIEDAVVVGRFEVLE